MRCGSVVRQPGGARVTLACELAATMDGLWAFLTQPEHLRQWLAQVSAGEAATGGTFELALDPEAGEVAR